MNKVEISLIAIEEEIKMGDIIEVTLIETNEVTPCLVSYTGQGLNLICLDSGGIYFNINLRNKTLSQFKQEVKVQYGCGYSFRHFRDCKISITQ